MAYTRDEPTDVDVGVSRPLLAANTNQADDSFGVDHVKFSVTTNNGYHHYLHLDAAYDGSAGITAPTEDITNIFATNTLATTTKPLPVFRNATGVGFLVPVGALMQFNCTSTNGTVSPIGAYINCGATGIQRTGTAANGTYTITFSKDFNNVNYHVHITTSISSYTITRAVDTLTLSGISSASARVAIIIYDVISSLT